LRFYANGVVAGAVTVEAGGVVVTEVILAKNLAECLKDWYYLAPYVTGVYVATVLVTTGTWMNELQKASAEELAVPEKRARISESSRHNRLFRLTGVVVTDGGSLA